MQNYTGRAVPEKLPHTMETVFYFNLLPKRWRAESNLPGLTLLIPVSHLPLTALNHAWQHKPPSLSDTHRAAGKNKHFLPGFGNRWEETFRGSSREKSEKWVWEVCTLLPPDLFPWLLSLLSLGSSMPSPHTHTYTHTYTYIWAVAFNGLGDAVLMFGTRGALEMPSFIETRWATAKRRDFFLCGAAVGIKWSLFPRGAEGGQSTLTRAAG